jgi:hypothetical protein
MSGYDVFTKQFDRYWKGPGYLRWYEEGGRNVDDETVESFLATEDEILTALERTSPLDGLRKMVLLVDQSGSMRGKAGLMTGRAVDMAASVLERRGIPTCVMAFTTSAWKGGQSREKWIMLKKSGGEYPHPPGRLNDRLHVVYKGFGDRWSEPDADIDSRRIFDRMYRDNRMRENLDGEAFEVARKMLRNARNGGILLFGDAAPVDDSTLGTNRNDFLSDHLCDQLDRAAIDGMATGVVRPATRWPPIDSNPACARFHVHAIIEETEDEKEDACSAVADALSRLGQAWTQRWGMFVNVKTDARAPVPVDEVERLGARKALKARRKVPDHELCDWTWQPTNDATPVRVAEPKPTAKEVVQQSPESELEAMMAVAEAVDDMDAVESVARLIVEFKAAKSVVEDGNRDDGVDEDGGAPTP